MQAINEKHKCAGQSEAGSNVCQSRETCGRYMRPIGDRQAWGDFWMAGHGCKEYESMLVDWDEAKIDFIARNGDPLESI